MDNKYICKDSSTSFTYEDLLYNSVPLTDLQGMPYYCPNGKKNCGILDTMNNVLCLESYLCPNNYYTETSSGVIQLYGKNYEGSLVENQPVIISVIFSENRPLNHEWKRYVKESYKDLDDEDIKKRRSLTKKYFRLVDKEEDDTYQKLDISFTVANIVESN